MRSRLNLGQRLALLREADAHPERTAELCARHGLVPDVLARWREEFRLANIREVSLAELRTTPASATTPEARELRRRLAGLDSLLRRRTAEIHALQAQLRSASTLNPTRPPNLSHKDMTHA